LGLFKEAVQFGNIGLKYADRNEGGIYDARAKLLFHNYIYHWSLPYYKGIDPVSKAIKAYWDAGAVELVHIETLPYLHIYFCTGLRLGPLMTDMRRFTRLMKDYNQMHSLESSLPFFQLISNLMGKSTDPTVLSGEFMDEERKFQVWTRDRNEKALQKLRFHKMILAYEFGKYELAWKLSQELWSPQVEGPDVWVPYRYFYEGLIAFAEFQRSGKGKYLRHGKSVLKRMEKWLQKGVLNCHHMRLLLYAEYLVATSASVDDVQVAYDSAISRAARAGFMNTQALANERAGMFFVQRRDMSWATTYLVRARDLYNDWGATAKAEHVSQTFRGILEVDQSESADLFGRSTDFRARTRLDLITAAHYDSLRISRISFGQLNACK
jgi:hypothetical protein